MVLSSRAAAIVGPIVWALAVEGLTPVIGKGPAYRAAVGTVAIAMVLAFILLRKVPDSLIMRLDKGRLSDPTGALRYPPRREAVGQ